MIILSPEVHACLKSRARREGLKLHIVSYGGSGTVFTSEWLNNLSRPKTRCLTPLWHSVINHYAYPIDLGVPRLCLMADPPTAYLSIIRRGLKEQLARHLHGGQYGQSLVEGMVTFFNNWTVTTPLIFCKYEVLHDYLQEIGEVLNVSLNKFPKRKERRTRAIDNDIDSRLLRLRERFNKLPDFFVRY